MDHRDQLVALSHAVGAPALDAAILGEGNTSIRVDDGTFLVKASGSSLVSLGADDLVHLRFDRILPLLSGGAVDEAQLTAAYEAARYGPEPLPASASEELPEALERLRVAWQERLPR